MVLPHIERLASKAVVFSMLFETSHMLDHNRNRIGTE
jgi:hypothetical protein